MILCENNLFLLKNDNLSYMLRADHRGVVRHVHFGESVRLEDAEALACRPGLGWGSSVMLQDRELSPVLCFTLFLVRQHLVKSMQLLQ